MRRIDDPSAVSTLPVPEAAGAEGYFTEGVPGVTPATLVRASFLNMVQEELRAVVTAAGLTPSKTSYNQVLSAIEILGRRNAGIYGVDTGVANTYQVAYTPAVDVLTDGMVLKFRAKTANTGASTFSPNGLAAAPIWGGDHVAVGGGEIIANGDVWLQWNSALNGGNGAWLLIDATGGYLKSPTPAQFDNSQKLATTGFVQRALGNFQTGLQFYANATLVPTDVGKIFQIAASGLTITLPLISAIPKGSSITFVNNTGAAVLQIQGAGKILAGAKVFTSSISLPAGESLTLTSVDGGNWFTTSGTAMMQYASAFFNSIGANGYQKLPGGLILQWGEILTTRQSSTFTYADLTFPIAFPNACVMCVHNVHGVNFPATNSNGIPFHDAIVATGCTLGLFGGSNTGMNISCSLNWIAIGY